jgi:hypothetical protein
MGENIIQLLTKLRQCTDNELLDALKQMYADGYAVAKDDKNIDEEWKNDLYYWATTPDYLLNH